MALFDTVKAVPIEVNRHVAFSEELRFVDIDFSGATFAAHIRNPKDVSGTPWLTFSFNSPTTAVEDGVTVTTVTMTASKALIDAIPYPGSGTDGERGTDVEASWDLLVDPSGGTLQLRFAEGPAYIRAGATIP